MPRQPPGAENGRRPIFKIWQISEWRDGNVFHRAAGIWFDPLNRPAPGASLRDVRDRLEARSLWLSDGPMKPEFLSEYLVGRVIGFLNPDCLIPLVGYALAMPRPAIAGSRALC